MTEAPILEVRDLAVTFRTEGGALTVVNDVSFSVRRGETLALVGESGSGKSVTSLAVLRLLPSPPRCTVAGSVRFTGHDSRTRDLLQLDAGAMQAVRGDEISMIFQEPMTSLNPVHRVGEQIAEAVTFHRGLGRKEALARAEELLELVGIPEPRRRLSAYPHHLSGGMRQRVMIAMALACDPSLLIADEPTTALDVTVQAGIIDLLKSLQAKTGMAILFVTHNLGVVAEIADSVMVMYAGRIVERGDAVGLLQRPHMPYTRGLLRSVPRIDQLDFGGGVLPAIPGSVPDPGRLPAGCSFHPRCGHARPGACDAVVPALEEAGGGRVVRCHLWREIEAGA